MNNMIEQQKKLFPRINIAELAACLASSSVDNLFENTHAIDIEDDYLNPVHNWKVMNALNGKRAIECQGDIDIHNSIVLETLYGDSPAGAEAWLKHSGACNSDDFDAIPRQGRKAHAKDEYKANNGINLFSNVKYNILKEVCHFGRFFAVRTEKFGWHLLEKINGVSIAPYMQKPNWKNFCFCLEDWFNNKHVPCRINATTNMLRYALAGRASDIAGIDMFLDFLSKVRATPDRKWLTTSNTKIFNAFIMVMKHSLFGGSSTIFDHFEFNLEAYKTHITATVQAMMVPRKTKIWAFICIHWKHYMSRKRLKKAEADVQNKGRALNRIRKRQDEAEQALETMERMSKRPRNANNQREL